MQENENDSTNTGSRDLKDFHCSLSEEECDCNYCDFRTNDAIAFRTHSRKHARKMFHCEHCDYTSSRSNNLKVHSRKHTGEMLHCQHCDYTTGHSGHLKRHSRTHTVE